MHPNALLDLATELLGLVLKAKEPADAVIPAFFRTHRILAARERHALAETAYAVLRKRLLYQHLARGGSGPLDRRLAIVGWQGSDTFLRSVLSAPEQEWLGASGQIDRSVLPDACRHNLPDWLAAPLQQSLGDGFWPLVASLDRPAPLDLRVNALKAKRDDVQQALTAEGFTVAPTPHSPWGLRVQGKPALHQLEVFKQGLVEVQDEGSQLLALLTDAKRGEMVVDFCAGAGGKTLALGASMRNTGRLYAFDTSGHRLDALKPRLARSGLSNVHPAHIAHERDDRIKRLAGKIDRVLVDAPCTGTGTLRRHPDLKWRLAPGAVPELQQRQIAILTGAARLLKSGGRLIYATCSLLESENEDVARAFDAAHGGVFEPVPVEQAFEQARVDEPGPLLAGPYLRLWPHVHDTDGFFAAAWTRR